MKERGKDGKIKMERDISQIIVMDNFIVAKRTGNRTRLDREIDPFSAENIIYRVFQLERELFWCCR